MQHPEETCCKCF